MSPMLAEGEDVLRPRANEAYAVRTGVVKYLFIILLSIK